MKYKALTLLLFGIAAAAAAQDRPAPPELVRLVSEALPPVVGDPTGVQRLFSPEISRPQLSEAFRIEALEEAVGESLAADPGCASTGPAAPPAVQVPCFYRSRGGSVLRSDFRKGKVDYINPERRFDWRSGIPNSLSSEEARARALRVATALALPQSEILTSRIQARGLNLGGADGEGRQRSVSLRAEMHVRVPRQVGGLPVLGSRFHAVLDARGQVARLHADWPDFALRPGLREDPVLSRDEVARRIAARIAESYTREDLTEVKIVAAYVPVDRLDGRDTPDQEEGAEGAEPLLFEPALVIHVIPVETAEDSGEVSLPILELTQPLLETPRSAEG
ncbi:MAG TPA: hypothetical protein VJ725_31075 [Thermoanaerobaculia bacterium]|nr:hypothetical protein [Thermoanaerobaculia bacterium]